MFNIANSDIFDPACEMVVLPISRSGTISPSFQNGLDKNNINLKPKKNLYLLGEIELHKVSNNKKIKYIVFACSVANLTSDYVAISQIGAKVAKETSKIKTIKNVAMPLLGTGVGKLDYLASLEALFNSFYNTSRVGIDLFFCVPNVEVFLSLKKVVFTDQGVSVFRVRQLILANFKTKSKRLDLGNCGLNTFELIPELFKCVHLEELILSNEWGEYENGHWKRHVSINKGARNILSALPNKLKSLKRLKVLISGGDWQMKTKTQKTEIGWSIKEISVVNYLTNLVVLNVSNNHIQNLTGIENLVYLEKLYLNNNNIIDFPFIPKLKSLKELYLSNNKIHNVASLRNLQSIKTLDLHSNQITNLSPLKNIINKIGVVDSKWTVNTISISSKNLKIPRPEVISQGKEKVIAYFNQLEAEGQIKLKEFINKDIKLVLVGNSNAGKSTLLYWLKNKIVKKDIKSTHWLELEQWQIKDKDSEFYVRAFDFGGQEYYHDTHHLFFTNQTAFIVLWHKNAIGFDELEVEQEQVNGDAQNLKIQTYPLNYWLDSINFYTQRKKITESEKEIETLLDARDKSITASIVKEENLSTEAISSIEEVGKVLAGSENVLVVQNKVDNPSNKVFLDEKILKQDYNKIFDFLSISVFHEKGLHDLSNNLLEIFKSIPIFGKPYLGTWGIIKLKIENTDFTSPFSLAEFKEYCNAVIKEIPVVKGKPSYQIAKVLFSNQDAESFAQFLNDIGILLFFPDIPIIKNKVFLNQKSILKNIYQILLGLDKADGEFNLIKVRADLKTLNKENDAEDIISLMQHFKIIFEHPTKPETFIAPLYLPKEPLQGIKIFSPLFKVPMYRYQYHGFIHKNVILDFFNHYGKHALRENDNSNLFYYWRDGIVVKDEITEEIIMIRFQQATNAVKCAFVDIYSIQNSKDQTFLNKIKNDLETINDGLGVEISVTNNGEDFVPLKEIHRNENEDKWLFNYNDKVYKLVDFKKHLIKMPKLKKVFVSYSKADTQHLAKLENHLSLLKRNGTIDTWNCRKLLPGEKWDGKIKKELEEADLILFLVSDDFLATDYIWDVEIKRAIERDNDPNDSVRVIPIIVRACDWEDSPLGIYNTAPKKAEVIKSAVNIDEAWTKVVKELKGIL